MKNGTHILVNSELIQTEEFCRPIRMLFCAAQRLARILLVINHDTYQFPLALDSQFWDIELALPSKRRRRLYEEVLRTILLFQRMALEKHPTSG